MDIMKKMPNRRGKQSHSEGARTIHFLTCPNRFWDLNSTNMTCILSGLRADKHLSEIFFSFLELNCDCKVPYK